MHMRAPTGDSPGDRLKRIIIETGLSQKEFAAAIQYRSHYISAICNNHLRPTPGILKEIDRVFPGADTKQLEEYRVELRGGRKAAAQNAASGNHKD